jgi:hypothetical protein
MSDDDNRWVSHLLLDVLIARDLDENIWRNGGGQSRAAVEVVFERTRAESTGTPLVLDAVRLPDGTTAIDGTRMMKACLAPLIYLVDELVAANQDPIEEIVARLRQRLET